MSAFYDQASLVVVPSGYKSGKIYAQKPLTTDGQLTFTRASTATRVNASGLIETVASGVPRLDYLGSSCPKLQLEPQRSNSVLRSQELDNAAWSRLNTTISANAAVAPDGTTTADLVYPTTTGTDRLIEQVIAATSGQTWTSSFFVKASGFSWVLVYAPNLGTCWFNASTGTFGTIAAGVTATVLGQVNGFWRVSFTGTINSGNAYFYAGLADANGTNTATTSGTNGLLFWGCQLELGAYATSYIKTTGAAVTRLADAAQTASVPSLIGQTAGTIFWQGKIDYLTSGDGHAFSLSESDSNFATAMLLYRQSSNAHIAFYMQIAGANQFGTPLTYNDTASISENDKYAIAYANNDLVIYKNGVQIISANSGSIPALNYLLLNEWVNTYNNTNITKQVLLFKTRLTNAQLAELTTL